MIRVYCDGSAPSTGGPAGVGYIAYVGSGSKSGRLHVPHATNQQAEILAAAYALHSILPGIVVVVSDSQYVVNGWKSLPRWEKNGWRRADHGDVRNIRHWQRLKDAAAPHVSVRFEWVKGHDGSIGNVEADRLAKLARLDGGT